MNQKPSTPVFMWSAAITILLVVLGIVIPKPFQAATQVLRTSITTNFGWLYLLLATTILIFRIFFIVRRTQCPAKYLDYRSPSLFDCVDFGALRPFERAVS